MLACWYCLVLQFNPNLVSYISLDQREKITQITETMIKYALCLWYSLIFNCTFVYCILCSVPSLIWTESEVWMNEWIMDYIKVHYHQINALFMWQWYCKIESVLGRVLCSECHAAVNKSPSNWSLYVWGLQLCQILCSTHPTRYWDAHFFLLSLQWYLKPVDLCIHTLSSLYLAAASVSCSPDYEVPSESSDAVVGAYERSAAQKCAFNHGKQWLSKDSMLIYIAWSVSAPVYNLFLWPLVCAHLRFPDSRAEAALSRR